MADIPINAVPRRVQFTGNTGLGPFAFSFEILLNTDIAVYKNSTLLTITTDYTVTINANGTGSVTLTGSGSGTALVASDYLTIIGDKPLARTTDFTTAGDLLASALNEQLDSSVVMTQQISERVDRALRQDPNDIDGDMTIPEKADRLGKVLRFNATTGNPETVSEADILGSGAFNVYNFVGNGSTTAFTLGTDPGVENNTQVYIDGVYQQKNTYTVSGTTLTFSAAPPNLSTIEVMVVTAQPVNTVNAASVSFTQAGSTDTRTVQAKLQETVSVKDFGAVGDGVTDDATSIKNAITYCINNGKALYMPSGTYLINSTIDFDTMPSGNFSMIGEEGVTQKNSGPVKLKGGSGLNVMFNQSFDISLATQRNLIFKNLSISSVDPFDDYTTRAALEAFNLYCCPYSEFENISFLGITSGIHVRTAWLSTFNKIYTSRVDKGIFVDGDDGSGSYGWADFCTLNNIVVGSFAKSGGYGLYLRGSRSSQIEMLDLETGFQANGLILEGCKNVEVDGIYTESYQTINPIAVKPFNGSSLTDIEDFSSNITLENIHSLSTGATGGTLSVVAIFKGSKNITIKNAKHFRGDLAGRNDEVGPLVAFSGSGLTDPGGLHYINGINLIDCALSDRETILITTNPYSQCFRINGTIVQYGTNRTYYGLTLNERDVYVNADLSTNQLVLNKGTLSTALSITASTTSGSRLITVDNTTNLFVGTYISVGSQSGLLVTSIDGLNVYLGSEITSTATGVVVSYTTPTYFT